MTPLGLLHLLSAIYLSGVICLEVSLNEHRRPWLITRETFRRWVKFLGFAFIIGAIVCLLDRG